MNSTERKHLAAWLVVPLFAVANGAIRDLTYARSMSRPLAHSLSVLPLVAAILLWAIFLERRWPLSRAASARVGVAWFALTVACELLLGTAMHLPIEEMLAAYDVTRGHLWPFVPLTMGLAPEAARRLRGHLAAS